MRATLLYFIFILPVFSYSQDTGYNIDSIQTVIDQYPDYDTNKLNSMFYLAKALEDESPSKHLDILLEIYNQSKIGKHPRQLNKACQELGYSYFYFGEYELSEKYMYEGIEIARLNDMNKALGIGLSDLGQVEDALEKDSLSIQHTLESIKVFEEIGEHNDLVVSYINLAGFYYYRNKIEKALEYYMEAKDIIVNYLSLRENYSNWAIVESNIGWCYYYMDDIAKAIEHIKQAVSIHTKYDYYSPSSGNSRASLAQLYIEKEAFDLARIHANDALDICREIEYEDGIGNAYYVKGEIAYAEGRFNEAAINFSKSLTYAENLGNLYEQVERAELLAKSYSRIGKYELAYSFISHSKQLNDSLRQAESDAAFEDAITKYETDKKEAENALLQEQSKLKDLQLEQERQEARAEQERSWIIGGAIGLILLSGLFFLINRNRLKTRTNRLLSIQRDEILEQQKEITDSITYAKRIQNSFLPPDKDFEKHFAESFLMYEPKDIVAGDFYILEEAGDYVFFSVADCTGHGVPGAMVSIVCSNAIRKVLHEMHEFDPGKVLNHTRDIVISQFERKGHTVNDGMDISFCRYDKKNKKIAWAGANNSLIVIKNGASQIHEIKPNKQPIGGYVTSDPFTTHEITVEKGDCIYMTSDGYPDQFGGEKGKKYKYKRFKELLIRNSNLRMGAQKAKISSEFLEWKQGFEQIDDVCVMGVRI